MLYTAKIAIALIVFVVVAELVRQYPKWGGLISALPWITVLVIVTRYHAEPGVLTDLVGYLWATFWFILPTLLFIALMAMLLHRGVTFYVSLGISIAAAAIGNLLVAYMLSSGDSTGS
jgi:hypothetical protein